MKLITVGNLVSLLLKENPNALVYLSSDPEGNTISPLGEGFSVGTIGNQDDDYGYVEGSGFEYPTQELRKEAENKPYIVIYPSL